MNYKINTLADEPYADSQEEELETVRRILLSSNRLEILCMYSIRLSLQNLGKMRAKPIKEELRMHREGLEFLADLALSYPFIPHLSLPTTEDFITLVKLVDRIVSTEDPESEVNKSKSSYRPRDLFEPFEEVYFGHRRETITQLLAATDVQLRKCLGFGGNDFISLLEQLISNRNGIAKVCKTPITDFRAYRAEGEPSNSDENGLNLVDFSDPFRIVPRSSSEARVAELLSIPWDQTPEHRRSSSILEKPIVKIGDAFFVIAPHILLFRADRLIENLLFENGVNPDKYLKARGDWFEDYSLRILNSVFPQSLHFKSYTNLTFDESNREAKINDAIIDIGEYIVILEAKSGRLTTKAWRASHALLARKLDKIFKEGSVQTKAVADAIERGVELFYKNSAGKTQSIPNLKGKEIIRLCVCLEPIGALFSGVLNKDFPGEIERGSLCFNIDDLQVICAVLNDPIKLTHYLVKRKKFTETQSICVSELNLLGLHIYRGIPVASPENAQGGWVDVLGGDWGGMLEKFLNGIGPRPQRVLPKRVKQLLRALNNQKPPLFLSTGIILLEQAYENLAGLSKMLAITNRVVKFGGNFCIRPS